MTEYLDLEDLLVIARCTIGDDTVVRDYPDLFVKGAALFHSLACNHALVDGDRLLARTACRTFLAVNEEWISAPEDDRFEFVIRAAMGGGHCWISSPSSFAIGA